MIAAPGAGARLAAARDTLANTDVMRRPEGPFWNAPSRQSMPATAPARRPR
jgi:hypothetical protein